MAARTKKKPQDTVSRFLIEGKPYEIDQENMTWGEIEDIEVYFGVSLDEIDTESGRWVMYLAYLARRRSEAGFTLDKMRDLTMMSVEADTEKRPTKAPASGGSPAS